MMEPMLLSSTSELTVLSVNSQETLEGQYARATSLKGDKGHKNQNSVNELTQEEVFHQLVNRCWQKAYWIAYDILGRTDEAEDVCQEALVKAYEKWEGFRKESSIDTWFYRIVTNLCLNQKRRRGIWNRVRDFVRKDKEQGRQEWSLPTSIHPEKQLQARELGQSIQLAMEQLSPKQHTVFVLRYLQDLSVKEIASITELSEGTVKTHIFRALQTLRGQLEHER